MGEKCAQNDRRTTYKRQRNDIPTTGHNVVSLDHSKSLGTASISFCIRKGFCFLAEERHIGTPDARLNGREISRGHRENFLEVATNSDRFEPVGILCLGLDLFVE